MPQVGCFGDIVFMVNSDVAETPGNAQWSGSARYAEHSRHLNNALTEFTGVDTDKFSFDLRLMRELGVDVLRELGKIWDYERSGVPRALVFGGKVYGKFRWSVRSHKVSMRYFDRDGNLSGADVSVSLLEYLPE